MRAALLCCVVLPMLVAAEPAVTRKTVTYDVHATEPATLSAAIDAASPISSNGTTYHGYTEYYLGWKFWWVTRGRNCQLNKVEVKVDIEFTMPKLVSRHPPRSLRTTWRKYYDALESHEEGHAKLAIAAGRQLEEDLLSLRAFTDCAKLEEGANALGQQQLQHLNEQQAEYDRRTEHGKRQGAFLEGY